MMPPPNGRPGRQSAPSQPSTAVVYLRVSTDYQTARNGLKENEEARRVHGLEAQEQKCREHCARMGWAVLAVHRDEGISGRDGLDGRPGLQAAVDQVRGAPGAVLVAYSVSRVARRQRLLWELLDERDGMGVPLSSATEAFDTTTPTGRAMLGMIATFAALEADMCSERTRDALAAAKAKGVRIGRPPAGANANVDTLNTIVRMHDGEKHSFETIAQSLNESYVPTVSGNGKWHARTVRAVYLTHEAHATAPTE